MRPGVRLGVDVGTARIGVAKSDPAGMLATPVETVARDPKSVVRLAQLAVELEAIEIVIGLPLALSGRETASTADARAVAGELATAQQIPVRLVDERLSTVSAQTALQRSGRNAKNSRSVIDQVAAVIILQHALDWERSADSPPGMTVDFDPRTVIDG
jgi:putative Holliday junction resolvase